MKQIAIYGKGGIGKSTIAANLSAALGLAGLQVLQVGCDPKQDSTRLLLQGRRVMTALDYLRHSLPHARCLEEIVQSGFAGVSCVEAGGPEPGIGCAGRGILSTFDLLEQLGIASCHYDLALYDVLGDVVCGGFAVPLRHDYAQVIYIVTSGEFMALYAGNNILRGIRNYEGRGPRVGGILFNERGLEDEKLRVQRFAEAVRLPIVATFPRSAQFSEAERLGQTILQAFPESDLVERFHRLAAVVSDDSPRLPALPLTPEDLEAVVLGARQAGKSCRSGVALPVAADVVETPRDVSSLSVPSDPPVPSPAMRPGPPPRRYCSKSVCVQGILHG